MTSKKMYISIKKYLIAQKCYPSSESSRSHNLFAIVSSKIIDHRLLWEIERKSLKYLGKLLKCDTETWSKQCWENGTNWLRLAWFRTAGSLQFVKTKTKCPNTVSEKCNKAKHLYNHHAIHYISRTCLSYWKFVTFDDLHHFHPNTCLTPLSSNPEH